MNQHQTETVISYLKMAIFRYNIIRFFTWLYVPINYRNGIKEFFNHYCYFEDTLENIMIELSKDSEGVIINNLIEPVIEKPSFKSFTKILLNLQLALDRLDNPFRMTDEDSIKRYNIYLTLNIALIFYKKQELKLKYGFFPNSDVSSGFCLYFINKKYGDIIIDELKKDRFGHLTDSLYWYPTYFSDNKNKNILKPRINNLIRTINRLKHEEKILNNFNLLVNILTDSIKKM